MFGKKGGYTELILESGEPLTAAMGLYRSFGFKVIQNYCGNRCGVANILVHEIQLLMF